jgi:hypothetical protein
VVCVKIDRTTLSAAIATAFLAGCGANGTTPTAPSNPAPIANNVLQLAVGTVNLYGTAKGINFVVTYRQPSSGFNPGDSGALVSSPSLHVPFKITVPAGSSVTYDGTSTAWTGPSGHEKGRNIISSTSQAPSASSASTFGQSGGAFGIGIEPFNLYGPADAPYPGLINSPFQVAPYPVPLYANGLPSGANVNILEPWGGPPAFDLLGNGQSPVGNSQVPTGQAGLSMGLDIFAMKPVTGTYGVNVTVQTSSQNFSQNAQAHLDAGKTLPAASAPGFVTDGSGGGTMSVKLPAGTREAYVQVSDYGANASSSACNSSGGSSSVVVYYTILARHDGTYSLPDHAGPGGANSICPGDRFTVQILAFDYGMYEASYPASLHDPKPPILGPRGQDDVTISPAACYVAPNGKGLAPACPAGTLPLPGQPQ